MKYRKEVYAVVFWLSYYSKFEVLEIFETELEADVFAFSNNDIHEYLIIQKRYIENK